MIRVVMDTNGLVSGILNRRSPGECLHTNPRR